ncbi:hypothetical protein [Parapedobacter sp. 10938]|uniref:hypothetical protein n=1 Tax=Parapedobacter flavus TaxID=3110225 RepID=UPI002DB5D641|nr:hypothetical protein [Parapedobacter sp. 10938]MEC3878668.1 hypothetical protein [Parapedobacter sp. 10938]
MKTLGLVLAFGLLIGMASCGNMNGNREDTEGADSLFGDSVANDSATWDTMDDTSRTTDSMASPSFP